MSERWKGILNTYFLLRYFALVCGLCFAFGGIASAQTDKCGTEATKGWNIENPSAEDRQAIEDLLFRYAWTIDEKDALSFAALFADTGPSYYEICNTGGPILKLTRDLGPESPDDLLTQMGIITNQLGEDGLQTRHLVTNTLFDVVSAKTEVNTKVNTKSIVLVTVQDSNASVPSIDYSADARASLIKLNDGTWRFQSLTIHADYPNVAAKKR